VSAALPRRPAPGPRMPGRVAGLVPLVGVWLALVALFGILADNFLSPATFTTLAGRLPALVLAATGMTLVIVTGGIDLAVGSVAALAGGVLGVALEAWKWPVAAALPLAVATGAAVGLGGGMLSVGLRLPSFLVTLGLLEACRGLTYAVSGSRTLFLGGRLEALLRPVPGVGLPATVLVTLAVAAAAQFVLALGRPDLAVSLAKRSAQRAGMLLGEEGWPVIRVPAGGGVERALVLATIRQESAFEADAVSPAGARGLMQLMPGTARETSGKIALAYRPEALNSDITYNVQLGSTYFQRMLSYYNGSYPLAVAAYNAGPGNVNKWLARNGDPRSGGIDILDWIEQIPIFETRNYVQRVLENAVMYDHLYPEKARYRTNTPLSNYLGRRVAG